MLPSGARKGSGRISVETISSDILKTNPLGDPFERILPVYLPPSYDNGSTMFPVVYCLAGYTSSAESWFNFQAWVPSIDRRMDSLIAGGMPEMILVFPDCFTRYGGSQYLDSSAVGNYRSYLLREIVPYMDARFRTKSERRFRGVMGKSSGGFGALSMAMDHPETFSAVACHSGDLYFEYAYLPEFPVAARGLEKAGGLTKFLDGIDRIPKTSREDHAVLNIVAMSACYSPNSNSKPHGFDLPFDPDTGVLIPEVWKRWKEKDPVEKLIADQKSLRDAGLVYLDCGASDEFHLNWGARLFANELSKRNITHIYDEFPGGHSNTQHRYDVSLRRMAHYFG